MPNTETIWLAKIIQKDPETDLFWVMVRGVFCDKAEARRIATTFGCDALVHATPGQQMGLGSIALVSLSSAGARS